MSGLDPNEASFQAIAHEIDANTEMNTGKDKDGFVFDEKRAVSPASDPTEAYGEHPDAPTEEEKRTLRRVPGPINIGAFLVACASPVSPPGRRAYLAADLCFASFPQTSSLPSASPTTAAQS